MDLENQNQNGSIRRKKKQNRLTKGDDRISKLSDSLIHHILSFLPTKFAARTSILSKRWRNMWIFSPVLDFREWRSPTAKKNTEIFMNSVDKMLFFHEDMPNIKKLYLQLDADFDETRINAWISIAIKRKVEELIIDFYTRYNFTISPSLFTCESLTVMELEVSAYLELPESIYFPRLKILRLGGVIFESDNSTQQLFSNCPILEEMILRKCNLHWLDSVSISAPALKYLSIDGSSYDLDDSSINIYAPSLLSLKYSEHVAKDFDLHGVPSLVDADIDFTLGDSSTETGDTASKLIRELFNVKLLKMSGNTFEISPNLETLDFAMGFEQGLSDDDNSWTLDLVPQCLLLHLKSIKFQQFVGHSGELNEVKLFLKNARILERMTVTCSSTLPTDMKNIVMELLQALPRSSPSCVFMVL